MVDLGGGVYERSHVAERKREEKRKEKRKRREREEKEKGKKKKSDSKDQDQLSFQRNPSSGGPGAWSGGRDGKKPIEKIEEVYQRSATAYDRKRKWRIHSAPSEGVMTSLKRYLTDPPP